MNTFTIDTDEYYPRYYNVNDVKTFKTPCILFYALYCANKSSYVYCILARLTGSLSAAVYYRISLQGYQIICGRSFSFAKSQQAFEIKPVNIQSRSP